MPPPRRGAQAGKTLAGLAVAASLLLILITASSAPTTTTRTLYPNTAAGDGWAETEAARRPDAAYAYSEEDDAPLALQGFNVAGMGGTIQRVRFLFDQSQADHRNDGWDLRFSASGCTRVTAAPTDVEPTRDRHTHVLTLSCEGGWTWSRLAALRIEVRTEEVGRLLILSGVDGEWRIHSAAIDVQIATSTTSSPGPTSSPSTTTTHRPTSTPTGPAPTTPTQGPTPTQSTTSTPPSASPSPSSATPPTTSTSPPMTPVPTPPPPSPPLVPPPRVAPIDAQFLQPGEVTRCVAAAVGDDSTMVPLAFDSECGVGFLLIQPPPGGAGPYTLEVAQVDRLPPTSEPPPLLSAPGPVLRLRLTDAQGRNVQPGGAVIQFRVDEAWRDDACPASECEVRLLHLTDAGRWDTLEAIEVERVGNATYYQSSTDGFSYFVPGLSPIAPANGGPQWSLLLAGVALVGAASGGLYVLRRRKDRADAVHADLRNQELVSFLNKAAHDLANPLTPIKLQLSMLKNANWSDLSPKQQKALDVVARNVEHMGMLVSDLRDAARLEAGRLKVEFAPVDLARLVEETGESFRDPARQAGLEFTVSRPKDALVVQGDKGRLTQVLYNLVGNALKFTPHGGSVRLSCEAAAGGVAVEVSDTGLGIAPQKMERLFQPFSQVHQAAAKKGSGLGLFIARGIVETHGGTITAESAGEGKGTTFRVVLPGGAAPPAPAVAHQGQVDQPVAA